MRSASTSLGLLLLGNIGLLGCEQLVSRAVPQEDHEFGRSYVAALRASDTVAIARMTKPSTLTGDFNQLVRVASEALNVEAVDTIRLREFEILRETGRAPATRLRYEAVQRSGAVEIELWVEDSLGRRYVETVRIVPRKS